MLSKLTKHQTQTHKKHINVDGAKQTIFCEIRYDDKCGNGHNSFAITGVVVKGHTHLDNPSQVADRLWEQCGCIHTDIRKHFPELAHLIKWHHMNSDGPMHYISNTLFHANSKDHWGLHKGEKRQIINRRSGKPSWELVTLVDGVRTKVRGVEGVKQYIDSDTTPEPINEGLYYAPWCRIGEGKEPDLQAARDSAIWPDATLEQLQDKDLLEARLPKLISEFKATIESLGMEF